MKVGLLVESEEGLDWEQWRTTFITAERLGFDSLWIADHLASPWSEERHGLEPWVALTIAAAETRRIGLGSLVSPITFRQPAVLARMVESIDCLAPGRLVLGLGLGWNAEEHATFGIPFPPVNERARLLSDGIQLIRRTLGEHQVPLLVGGGGPRSTLPLVARFADEWNLTTSSVDVYSAASERLAELCDAIGRDPLSIKRSIAAGVLIGRDAAELAERSARMRRLVLPLSGIEVDDVPAATRRMGWVAGTCVEVVAALRPLADVGVDLAILGHYDHADVDALELIASDVLPALA
jgi:alkanesulfonate monooxygenase SsuD/methylene tetrahydromethanopterin reductase-like flavin-dependent oxidoreductase (luciferase family)